MTKINDLEYAESNYPNYWWFWTYPFWLIFGDSTASEYKPERGDGHGAAIPNDVRMKTVMNGGGFITYGELGKWLTFQRCPCGVGYSTRWVSSAPKLDCDLCKDCGRDAKARILWIGRRIANRWEWKPESELPVDLTPMGRLAPETDFDARVKAAVEVEVLERMATMKHEK